jgi:hypothetical protein
LSCLAQLPVAPCRLGQNRQALGTRQNGASRDIAMPDVRRHTVFGRILPDRNSFLCLNVRRSTECYVIVRYEGCFRDDYSIRKTSLDSFRGTCPSVEFTRAMSAQLSLGEFYPPLHQQFCPHESDAVNGLPHSEAISQVLARTLDPPSARQQEHTRRLSRCE